MSEESISSGREGDASQPESEGSVEPSRISAKKKIKKFPKKATASALGLMFLGPFFSAYIGDPRLSILDMPNAFWGISLAGLFIFLAHRFIFLNHRHGETIVSICVLTTFTLIGLAGSNDALSRLFWFFADGEFVSNNRYRWEAVAVISTAYMAWIYLDVLSILRTEEEWDAEANNGVMIMTILAVLSAIAALGNMHDLPWHFFWVVVTAILFCWIDAYVGHKYRNSKYEAAAEFAREAQRLFWNIDLPITLGLVIIAVYVFTSGNNCDPEDLNKLLHDMEGLGVNSVKQVIEKPCFEIYPLIAGALAFHMIAFNMLYICSTLDLEDELNGLVRYTKRKLASLGVPI